MFDGHSYSKGGFILHMLRHTVGDEAFKKSLQLYLNRYAYQNAEVHQLRLVFEEVTGEDLNWFFNQWFLGSGHPILNLQHDYSEENKELSIYATQSQNFENLPVFRLPIRLEYKSGDKIETVLATIDQEVDTIMINMEMPPDYVNFDPGKTVLAEVEYEQNFEAWESMFNHTALGNDRRKAIVELSNDSSYSNDALFAKALRDSLWEIRAYALNYFGDKLELERNDSLKGLLMHIAYNDPEWRMTYMSMSYLGKYYKDDEMVELCKKNMNEESIMVASGAIRTFTDVNAAEARKMIDKVIDFEYASIASAVAAFYISEGQASDHDRLLEVLGYVDGYQKYQVIKEYGNYLTEIDDSELGKAIPFLKESALKSDQWWIRMVAQKELIKVDNRVKSKWEEEMKASFEDFDGNSEKYKPEESNMKLGLEYSLIRKTLEEIKKTETRENLISVLNDYLEKGILPKN
jgi:aminopeptidase N